MPYMWDEIHLTLTRESDASAKPAPSLKETIRDIRALVSIAYKRKAQIAPEAIEPFLKALEALLAAERTALKEIAQELGQTLAWMGDSPVPMFYNSMDAAIIVHKAVKRLSAVIDAQERAGAKT